MAVITNWFWVRDYFVIFLLRFSKNIDKIKMLFGHSLHVTLSRLIKTRTQFTSYACDFFCLPVPRAQFTIAAVSYTQTRSIRITYSNQLSFRFVTPWLQNNCIGDDSITIYGQKRRIVIWLCYDSVRLLNNLFDVPISTNSLSTRYLITWINAKSWYEISRNYL